VSIDDLQKNLEETIEQAKKFGDKIYILNIAPVVEELTAHLVVDKDRSRLNKNIDLYNQKIKEVVDNKGVALVDVNKAFIDTGYKDLIWEDGLHPNGMGHEVIFSEVLKIAKLIVD
jgi:lysophospholipase L1-like esterase